MCIATNRCKVLASFCPGVTVLTRQGTNRRTNPGFISLSDDIRDECLKLDNREFLSIESGRDLVEPILSNEYDMVV